MNFRPSRAWSALTPSRVVCVLAAVVSLGVATFLFSSRASAQGGSRRPASPLQFAARAYNEGRYDEVDQIVDKLDARDPNAIVWKARAAIARGRYVPAEQMLRPVAGRAPAGEAALELGLLCQFLGRADARAILQKVADGGEQSDEAVELARAARAMRALGQFQAANEAFRDAQQAAPTDPVINTAWGELFLEKYVPAEAVKSFQAALQVDSKYVPAMLGMARAVADDNPPQAVTIAQHVLEVNPASVDAQVFLASQAVDAGRHDEARASLAKALAVNPSSVDAHALLAAIAYVEDQPDEFKAESAKALAVSPRNPDVYRTAGEVVAHNYRFDEAVALTRQALALEPGDPESQADLGMQLLRTGDEPAARQALDASFKADPYNRVTFNLLGLLDNLDKFVTVRDGDLILRLQKDEAPVLREYAIPLAHQALTTLSARYEFTPRGPILIEIFPKHDDFAVRNLGLPGMIGALGACFGRVVTMDSPHARPPGEFQWEATLWHELAHVVTLQMSNQRVPRWLTEGISVYEEKRARPEWGREMDVEFADLLEHGKTIKLVDLNAAFTDPNRISLAYYEASLLVEHLIAAYGDEGLRKLLRAYGSGLQTDAALKSALNTSFEQLQTGFDQTTDRLFGPLRRALAGPDPATLRAMPLDALKAAAAGDQARSFRVQMALGRALEKAGDLDQAMAAFERAAALVPVARGRDSAHFEMAGIAAEKKDRAREIAELQALVAVDFNEVEAARRLAALMRSSNIDDPARTGPVYARIAAIDPFDADAHSALGKIAMARGNPDDAAREFRAVIAIGPVDPAAAHTDLAESYYKSGKRAEAKKQTLAALEIAPTYVRAQDLLLKLAGERQ
jgi:tetratricopeptide (TPR) repeat protein